MGRRASGRRRVQAGFLALAVAVLVGCAVDDPTVAPSRSASAGPEISVEKDVPFREVDGVSLSLDVCTPAEPTGSDPAVLLIHGGGFSQGSKDDEGIQNLCVWFAENGYVAVPVSYRLDGSVYPAQLEDVQGAVSWLREPAQAERFGIDPARIGALGSSAGGILSMSLGTFGEGPLAEGSRVGAVVALSGVSDMGPTAASLGAPTAEAASLILAYLGCTSVTDCAIGAEASPLAHVTAGDSPGLFFASDAELVPYQQSQVLADALVGAGVGAQALIDPGSAHGLPLLTTDNRAAILAFLEATL